MTDRPDDAALREGLYWKIRNQMAEGIPDDLTDHFLIEDYIINRELDNILAYLTEAGALLPEIPDDVFMLTFDDRPSRAHGGIRSWAVNVNRIRPGKNTNGTGSTLVAAVADALKDDAS